jgi:hypothetical protein
LGNDRATSALISGRDVAIMASDSCTATRRLIVLPKYAISSALLLINGICSSATTHTTNPSAKITMSPILCLAWILLKRHTYGIGTVKIRQSSTLSPIAAEYEYVLELKHREPEKE